VSCSLTSEIPEVKPVAESDVLTQSAGVCTMSEDVVSHRPTVELSDSDIVQPFNCKY